MNLRRHKFGWVLGIFIALQGCSKSSSSSKLSVPSVTTIVKASLPHGLQPGNTTPVPHSRIWELARADRAVRNESVTSSRTTTPSNAHSDLAAAYLTNLFQDTFSSSKGNTKGYLLAQVATVDDRMSLFQAVDLTGCLANPVKTVHMDLSAIDPMLDFTLSSMQCYAPFGASTSDSGEAFGQSGSTTSLWVQASDNVATTGTAGINYANVKNAGSTSASAPEQVDGLTLVFTPNTGTGTGGMLDIARYVATPATNTFEMFYGGSGGVISTASSPGDDAFIGVGFRMISNGTYIYADGRLCTTASTSCGGGPSSDPSWDNFDVCLNAADLTVHSPATDCTTLANSFTLNNTNAHLTYQEITGDAHVGNSYGVLSGAPGPTDANAALVLPLAQIAKFHDAATKYGP